MYVNTASPENSGAYLLSENSALHYGGIAVWRNYAPDFRRHSNRLNTNYSIVLSTINTFKEHLSSELESEAVKFKVSQL